jgi:hypothetical protein
MESERAADEAMLNKVHPKIQANGRKKEKKLHWEERREKYVSER